MGGLPRKATTFGTMLKQFFRSASPPEARPPFIRVSDTLGLYQPYPALAPALFDLVEAQRAHLHPFLPWVSTVRTLEDAQKHLRSAVSYNRKNQRLMLYLLEAGELLGAIGLVNIYRADRKAELGYWLRADRQGEGLITRCAEKLMHHAYVLLQYNRLFVQVAADNTASRAVAERLGFRLEGRLREATLLHGAFHHVCIYGHLRTDWQARKNG